MKNTEMRGGNRKGKKGGGGGWGGHVEKERSRRVSIVDSCRLFGRSPALLEGHRECDREQLSSVQFSSVQDGFYAIGKAHMRSTPSLGSFPDVALETVPMLV